MLVYTGRAWRQCRHGTSGVCTAVVVVDVSERSVRWTVGRRGEMLLIRRIFGPSGGGGSIGNSGGTLVPSPTVECVDIVQRGLSAYSLQLHGGLR